jgi:hypothetical protein
VKTTVHARLSAEDCEVLDALKKVTGLSESDLVRRGIRLVHDQMGRKPTALDLAGPSVGKFRKGHPDLSTNPGRMDGFGE